MNLSKEKEKDIDDDFDLMGLAIIGIFFLILMIPVFMIGSVEEKMKSEKIATANNKTTLTPLEKNGNVFLSKDSVDYIVFYNYAVKEDESIVFKSANAERSSIIELKNKVEPYVEIEKKSNNEFHYKFYIPNKDNID